jgi:hypothetical protein
MVTTTSNTSALTASDVHTPNTTVYGASTGQWSPIGLTAGTTTTSTFRPSLVSGPSDTYKYTDVLAPKDKNVDWEHKYWGEVAYARDAIDTLRSTVEKLRSENEALRKALEGFVGVSV